MEIDLATAAIRNLTAYYPHHGYIRALYLANGDILLPARSSSTRASAKRGATLAVRAGQGPTKPPSPWA